MILVTGASGNVGRCVVRLLHEAGRPVRALTRGTRDTDFPADVEYVQGDLREPETLAGAFDGVERMFLFTPPAGPGAMAKAAHASGVRHAVLLSSIVTQKADPGTNPIAARHCAAEQAVVASGLSWTFLRPDTFASNALEWAGSIRAEGIVRAAFGLSRRCPIHEQDVAAVAALALLESGHDGASYWLTGPKSVTIVDQVEAISRAVGKPILFEELTRDEALELAVGKMPKAAAERLLDYAARSVDAPPPTTDTVERLLRRAALPFDQWARDHVGSFT
ncbi:MAG: NAD(P)H-binding protein [Defluviicoccus sp.]|nr:NAD(P)H-binding protein [Defluviicoccus sp.]